MVFPEDIEIKLGFDTIRDFTRSMCISMAGKMELSKCFFETDFEQVKSSICRVSELKNLIEFESDLPDFNFFQIDNYFERIVPEGSYLEENEIWEICITISTGLGVYNFLKEHSNKCTSLSELNYLVEVDKDYLKEISKFFDNSGKIKDNATPKLERVRRQFKDAEKLLRKSIEKSFKEAVSQGYVEEGSSISVRNGRVVIPIKSAERKKIKGLIHDQSTSGSILFIEPEEVVEINNLIQDWTLQERKEVIKILGIITSLLRSKVKEIESLNSYLGKIDFLRAKALVGLDLNSIMPELVESPVLNFKRAFHPILTKSYQKNKKEVIPLDIEINSDQQRIVLISGPNAGGKSVSLKTVGLLQYMLQCGFLIPVKEGSKAGLFKSIFIDIGDEQSIEDDLSTYSSHLNHMKIFLKEADQDSLILIDEFGAGTEPSLGGAMAEAILHKLVKKKCKGVITTHFSNLKKFAELEDGIMNAAMLFDSDKLLPLYKLKVGIPGSSFALEIASKMGISVDIIENVKSLLGSSYLDYEEMLNKLEVEREKMAIKINELEQELLDANLFKRNYKKLHKDLEEEKNEILILAKKEAQRIIAQSNKEIERVIREIKESKADKSRTKAIREELSQYSKKVAITKKSKVETNSDFKVGDTVEIIKNGVRGIILNIRNKEAELQAGSLKSKVKLAQLKKYTGEEKPKNRSKSGYSFARNLTSFSQVLDIRGNKVEEAIPKLDKFLDDALLSGVNHVKILHGKGTGVLREMVREQLQKADYVKNYSDEKVELGGSGITIINLK